MPAVSRKSVESLTRPPVSNSENCPEFARRSILPSFAEITGPQSLPPAGHATVLGYREIDRVEFQQSFASNCLRLPREQRRRGGHDRRDRDDDELAPAVVSPVSAASSPVALAT